MRKALFLGALGTVLVCVGGGVAAAEPVKLANVEQSKSTVDGWTIKVSLNEATINSVPNMAAAIIVREGFITATANVAVEGNNDMKVKTSLAMFAQLGCQANIEQGATLDFDTSVATSLPALDFTPTPDELALAPTAAFSPEVIATLRPGDIIDQSLGEIAYPPKEDLDNHDSVATDGLTVSVKDYHIKINKCGGAVAIRLVVQGTIATAKSFNFVRAYSDILSL